MQQCWFYFLGGGIGWWHIQNISGSKNFFWKDVFWNNVFGFIHSLPHFSNSIRPQALDLFLPYIHCFRCNLYKNRIVQLTHLKQKTKYLPFLSIWEYGEGLCGSLVTHIQHRPEKWCPWRTSKLWMGQAFNHFAKTCKSKMKENGNTKETKFCFRNMPSRTYWIS